MNISKELLEAVKQGLSDEIEPLLDLGANLRADGDAALREAAMKGDAKMVRVLLRKYPDSDSINQALENMEGYISMARVALKSMQHECSNEKARRILRNTPSLEI